MNRITIMAFAIKYYIHHYIQNIVQLKTRVPLHNMVAKIYRAIFSRQQTNAFNLTSCRAYTACSCLPLFQIESVTYHEFIFMIRPMLCDEHQFFGKNCHFLRLWQTNAITEILRHFYRFFSILSLLWNIKNKEAKKRHLSQSFGSYQCRCNHITIA